MDFPSEPIENTRSIMIDRESGRVFITNPDLWSIDETPDGRNISLDFYLERDKHIILPAIFRWEGGRIDVVFENVKQGDHIRIRGQKVATVCKYVSGEDFEWEILNYGSL